MTKIIFHARTNRYSVIIALFAVLSSSYLCNGSEEKAETRSLSTYEKWEAIGTFAAETSLGLIGKAAATPRTENLVVLTNAGYAEVGMSPTQGALDGLTKVTGASRGRNTLVEIHSAFGDPLWFALYDKGSGFCTYLEVDPSEVIKLTGDPAAKHQELFKSSSVERIDTEYLYRHAAEYRAKFNSKVFGGNEFRIITIANAVAAGIPPDAVRAFEFHDHFCPGITSGILMARYLKVHFPSGEGGYFIHAVEPWCKEDALMVLLNATPGKKSYAASYPSKEDIAGRIPEAKNASTIVYRKNDESAGWEGLVLGFEWAKTSCSTTGNDIVDKLCDDLWYLERMDKPEKFITVIRRFELPEGIAPSDWARPGVDPLKMLGLAKKE